MKFVGLNSFTICEFTICNSAVEFYTAFKMLYAFTLKSASKVNSKFYTAPPLDLPPGRTSRLEYTALEYVWIKSYKRLKTCFGLKVKWISNLILTCYLLCWIFAPLKTFDWIFCLYLPVANTTLFQEKHSNQSIYVIPFFDVGSKSVGWS